MRPLRFERHELGPRLHLFGRRFHHYHAGLMLISAGVYLLKRDWDDFLKWVLHG